MKTLITNVTQNDINTIKGIRDNGNRTDEDILRCDKILASFEAISLNNYFKENNITKKEDKQRFQYENAYRIFSSNHFFHYLLNNEPLSL